MTDRPADRVDAVATAVRAVPGVHDLHGGGPVQVATYLPGRRVLGVRLLEPGAEVHVTLDWDAPLAETAGRVREAVRPLTGRPVHVHVEDVTSPPDGLS
jgi:hypothetical protein